MRRFIGDKPRAIAEATYAKFAKRYHISTKNKPMKQLAQEIYEHERRAKVRRGLYYAPR
jgi:hypothetical protein